MSAVQYTHYQLLHVHPSSVMFTRTASTGWVIYHEVIETSKSFMRDVTVIDEEWLVELAYVERTELELTQDHTSTHSVVEESSSRWIWYPRRAVRSRSRQR